VFCALSHVSTMADRKRRPRTLWPPPVTIPVDTRLLAVVRATHPTTRDWTDAQVTAACLALALRLPRIGTVHTD
jgi:hypothetical protein